MPIAETENALWQDYRTQLYRFVLKRVEDAATAEDIVHDVLLRAYEHRDTLRHGTKFEPWLYRITRNAIIDHYRRRRPTDSLPDDMAAPEEPSARDARRELAACMTPLVDALPPHYRDALVLAELQGLTQQDTSERLGLTLSGAKSRVQRARRMLEAKLLDCCEVELDSRGSISDYERRKDGDSCGDCGAAAC